MESIRFPSVTLLFLCILDVAAISANSSLEFVHFSGSQSIYTGADAEGYIYEVGITPPVPNVGSPPRNAVKATQGALDVEGSREKLFVRKYSPDGSELIFSALIAEPYTAPWMGAHVDGAGFVYLSFQILGNVAGDPMWQGDSGNLAVLKLAPEGDHFAYATRLPFYLNPAALAVDSDGSVYVASSAFNNVALSKLDPFGVLRFTYETPPESSSFSDYPLKLTVGPDHSAFITGRNYVYRVNPDGTDLVYRRELEGGLRQNNAAIAVDSASNAYVVGSVPYSDRTPPIQAVPVGFVDALPESRHAYVIKLAPDGSTVYATLLPQEELSAVTSDPDGGVWAMGPSRQEFSVVALAPSGTAVLHVFSIPALPSGGNSVSSITLDAEGRALLSATTKSSTIPDLARRDSGSWNGFFSRISANPPRTDLHLSAHITPAAVAPSTLVTVSATVRNDGGAAAEDVVLRFQDVVRGLASTPPLASNYIGRIISCRVSGGGSCRVTRTDLTVFLPTIASGASEAVEVKLRWIWLDLQYPEYALALSVTASGDDPNPNDNYVTARLPQYSDTELTAWGTPSTFRLRIDDRWLWIDQPVQLGTRRPSIIPNSDVRIYVPSPQIIGGKPYVFESWVDGSKENPRWFRSDSMGLVVYLSLRQPTAPWVHPDAPVVSAASFRTGPVAPGQIITLFGVNLGPSTLLTAQLDPDDRIATELDGFRVFFDDVPAPVVHASATQAAVIVPYSVAGKHSVRMRIVHNESSSEEIIVPVVESAPGLFTANSSGTGPLVAFNGDGSQNSVENPAEPGEIVAFFGTGEGVTEPIPPDGAIAGETPPKPKLRLAVAMGGEEADIVYAGGVPGLTAGLLQINARVPEAAKRGLLPVVLTVGPRSSQRGGTIAVR